MNIYVASSWRCPLQAVVVRGLRNDGHEVYDFKSPKPGNNGFSWKEVNPDWENFSARQFRDAMSHPLAKEGFHFDLDAMKKADACVLVVPDTAGRSSHLELGWMAGAGKKTCILLNGGEPELMYKLADFLAVDVGQVFDWAMDLQQGAEVEPGEVVTREDTRNAALQVASDDGAIMDDRKPHLAAEPGTEAWLHAQHVFGVLNLVDPDIASEVVDAMELAPGWLAEAKEAGLLMYMPAEHGGEWVQTAARYMVTGKARMEFDLNTWDIHAAAHGHRITQIPALTVPQYKELAEGRPALELEERKQREAAFAQAPRRLVRADGEELTGALPEHADELDEEEEKQRRIDEAMAMERGRS